MKDTFEYDLAIHLAGGQAIPNLLGVRLIKAKRHLLLVSDRTKTTFDKIKKCLPPSTVFEAIELNAFDLDEISNVIKRESQTTESIAFNLTGGTKIMAFGVLNAVFDIDISNIKFFYFNTEDDEILSWKIGTPSEKEPIDKILKLKDFFALSHAPKTQENVDERLIKSRKDVTTSIWKNSRTFAKIQSVTQKALLKSRHGNYSDFEVGDSNNFFASRHGKDKELIIDGKPIDVSQWDDFTEYLAGRWFEEYIWLLLQPMLEEGQITELKIGLTASSVGQSDNPVQEFDLLVTDGLRLTVLECKAGFVDQDMFNKVEENVKNFAGVQGRGILLLRWPLDSQNKAQFNFIQRLKADHCQCSCIHGGQISTELTKRIFTIKPREFFRRSAFLKKSK